MLTAFVLEPTPCDKTAKAPHVYSLAGRAATRFWVMSTSSRNAPRTTDCQKELLANYNELQMRLKVDNVTGLVVSGTAHSTEPDTTDADPERGRPERRGKRQRVYFLERLTS